MNDEDTLNQLLGELGQIYCCLEIIRDSLWNRENLVQRAELRRDLVRGLTGGVDMLLGVVRASRDSKDVAWAAANALTLLSDLGYSFYEEDLRGICAVGADALLGRISVILI